MKKSNLKLGFLDKSCDLSEGDKEKIRNRILNAIEGSYCDVLKSSVQTWDSASANSRVYSIPNLDLNRFLPGGFKEFALNIIHVEGNTNECMHYHTSHVVGVVLDGIGDFYVGFSNDRSKADIIKVCAGDLVVIPKDAFHIFDCPNSELILVSVELSNVPIDYQAHHF